MAFCLLLLVVAGLFTRSLQCADADRRRLRPRPCPHRARRRPRRRLYPRRAPGTLSAVSSKLEVLPGVQSVSMSAKGPLANSPRISSLASKATRRRRDERVRTNEEIVTDRYFETDGTAHARRPRVRPRGSRAGLAQHASSTRRWPGASFRGRARSANGGTTAARSARTRTSIVGVVEDARYVDLRWRRRTWFTVWPTRRPTTCCSDIEIRTAGAPGALAQTRARDARRRSSRACQSSRWCRSATASRAA